MWKSIVSSLRLRYALVGSIVLFLLVVSMSSSNVFACNLGEKCGGGGSSGSGGSGGSHNGSVVVPAGVRVLHNVVIVSVVVISHVTDNIPIAHVVNQLQTSIVTNATPPSSPFGAEGYGLAASALAMLGLAGYLSMSNFSGLDAEALVSTVLSETQDSQQELTDTMQQMQSATDAKRQARLGAAAGFGMPGDGNQPVPADANTGAGAGRQEFSVFNIKGSNIEAGPNFFAEATGVNSTFQGRALNANGAKSLLTQPSDLSQLSQQRMQMEMDEFSKVYQMLSNFLKSIEELFDNIVGNFK
jgi:hypothetical protein